MRRAAQVGGVGNPLSHCELCPRRCGVDRLGGRTGYCGSGVEALVYRYAPHFGEEPPISGCRGSGTVFFSRCTLRCGYCQNYPWSQEGRGRPFDDEQLAGVLRELCEAGCHNWNLVSPTPWLPRAARALDLVRASGCSLPVVFNTSGYERGETLRRFDAVADIYLTDLRYACAETAALASDAGDYVVTARAALLEMWRRAGPLRLDAEGIAVSGVICRLLVLPGRAGEAIANLEWLAEMVGNEIAVSIMGQYHPVFRAASGLLGTEWARRVRKDEYEEVCSAVHALGFESGWIQDFSEEPDADVLGCEMKAGRGMAPAVT